MSCEDKQIANQPLMFVFYDTETNDSLKRARRTTLGAPRGCGRSIRGACRPQHNNNKEDDGIPGIPVFNGAERRQMRERRLMTANGLSEGEFINVISSPHATLVH